MRYFFTGEVHKDFHGLACATLHYLLDNYGIGSVCDIMKNVAQKVHKTMYHALKDNDFSELEEWWRYYLDREGGGFTIEKMEDGIRLCVSDCPALRHLVTMGQKPDSIICEATQMFNEALTEGTPYMADMVRTGDFSCIQTFRRREERV